MKTWRRLEDAISSWLEQGFARLTRASLQPVSIARRLEQAMEDGRVIDGRRTLVPNQYWVFVHPQDYQSLATLTATLETDLGEHLVEQALAAGWTFLSRPHVRINPGRDVRRHEVRVITQLAAAESPPVVEGTQPLPAVSATLSSPIPGSLSTPDGGLIYPLTRVTVDIGRARGNDIILDDPRVSRHHAQIRRRRGRFVIFDLDSANGTFVNGRPVEEAVLAPGDRLSFGGLELVFRIQDGGNGDG